MELSFDQIINELKKKVYHPIYLLMGEEPYYIDLVTNYIMKNVLSEEEKSFNQILLYGKDSDVATVINTAKRFPMMAKYQVVVLKEAQYLKNIDALLHYSEQPLSSTILVINYKYAKLNKSRKLYKSIKKTGAVLETKKLRDYEVPQWISKYLREKKYNIDQKAAILLTEFLGSELEKIVNELNKLFIILPEGSTITSDIVERNIGISKEYNIFELQNALSYKKVIKAYKIVDYLGKNQHKSHISVTLSMLFSYFVKVLTYHNVRIESNQEIASRTKIHPFFIKDLSAAAGNYPKHKIVEIISLIREYDMQSKGVNNNAATAEEILKELISKILL